MCRYSFAGVIEGIASPKSPKGNLFVSDEVENLTALSDRASSTLLPTLRSAFTGKTIGFMYRKASDEHVPHHTYRLTLVVNVQAPKAGALLEDSGGGTAQRFMWFPAKDTRITREAMKDCKITPLSLPTPGSWQYSREVRIPDEARDLICNERAKNMRDEQDALDSHSLHVREKFGYALAVLDGRFEEITSDDWRLAGIAMQVSDHARERTRKLKDKAEIEKEEKLGELRGVGQAAASEEKAFRETARLNRIADWVMDKLKENRDGLTEGRLRHIIARRDAPYLPTVLRRLSELGKIRLDGKKWVKV